MAKQEPIKVPRFEEAAGFYTTERQSQLMRKIRAANSKAEVAFRKVLWNMGFRYRLHCKNLPGKPDIVFRRWKIVIFIDGDFWHGYDWGKQKQRIKKNRGYWIPKIERNMQRDQEANEELIARGWQIIRIWEHEVKKEFGATVLRVLRQIEYLNNESDIYR